jgi:predicted exporter
MPVSDDLPQPEPLIQPTPEENAEDRAAEAAAIRRRWITLGEVLAVIAVVISGLTLWNNWSDRRDDIAVKTADARQASAKAATLVLIAADHGERTLALKPTSPEQSVQSQKIIFPAALGAAPAERPASRGSRPHGSMVRSRKRARRRSFPTIAAATSACR